MDFDTSAWRWSECQTVQGMEEKYQNSVISTISQARAAYILRWKSIYSDNTNFSETEMHPYEIAHGETVPLFQSVPLSIVQCIASWIQNILSDPEQYIQKFIECFRYDTQKSLIFGYISFPAICFYYMTPEFIDIATKVIFEILKYDKGELALFLLAGFYDSISNFLTRIWSEFNYSLTPEKSTIVVFLESIKEGFSILTPKHQEFTKKLIKEHHDFAIKFFTFYFSKNHDFVCDSTTFAELLEILQFAEANPSSAITNLILKAFDSETSSSPYLSFSDMNLQVTHVVLSGMEAELFFQALLETKFIKPGSKISQITIPKENVTSLYPGSMQYTHKRFLALNKSKFMPLIFEPPKDLKLTKNADFKRDYEHILSFAKEYGLLPHEIIDNPPSAQILEIIRHIKSLNNPEFHQYIHDKTLKLIYKEQTNFENFFEWISTDIGLKRCQNIFSLDVGHMEVVLSQSEVLAKQPSTETLKNIPYKDLAFVTAVKQIYNIDILKKPSAYVILCALHLINVWPILDVIPKIRYPFVSCFLQVERRRIIIENKDINPHYLEIAHKIFEDSVLPIGERILRLIDLFVQLSTLVGAEYGGKFAETAVDILILSGREDFMDDFMALDSVMTKFYKSFEMFNNKARNLWLATLSCLLERLSMANHQYWIECMGLRNLIING